MILRVRIVSIHLGNKFILSQILFGFDCDYLAPLFEVIHGIDYWIPISRSCGSTIS